MRAITLVLVLLVFILGLSWFTLNYLQTSSQEMLQQIDSLETRINDENWTEAQQHLKEITSRWENAQKNWKIILDHRETDEIALTLAKLKSFTIAEDQGEALAELSALRFLLEHIPRKERLLLRNIF